MAKYQYKVKGVDYEVEIQDIEGNIANVTVNGIPFEAGRTHQNAFASKSFDR